MIYAVKRSLIACVAEDSRPVFDDLGLRAPVREELVFLSGDLLARLVLLRSCRSCGSEVVGPFCFWIKRAIAL